MFLILRCCSQTGSRERGAARGQAPDGTTGGHPVGHGADGGCCAGDRLHVPSPHLLCQSLLHRGTIESQTDHMNVLL